MASDDWAVALILYNLFVYGLDLLGPQPKAANECRCDFAYLLWAVYAVNLLSAGYVLGFEVLMARCNRPWTPPKEWLLARRNMLLRHWFAANALFLSSYGRQGMQRPATVLITLDCWLLFVSLTVLSANIKCLDGQVAQNYRRFVYFGIRLLFCLSFITLFLVACAILKRLPLLMTPWFLTNAAHVIAVPMLVAASEMCFSSQIVLFTLPLRLFLGLTMYLLYEDLQKADSQEVYFRWYVQHMRQELESDGPANHSFA